MKRDMELARQILQRVEDCPHPYGRSIDLAFPDRTQDEVAYNIKLLAQAGLLQAVDVSDSEGFCWTPQSLTNEGHEFLDAIRNDTVWSKVKETVKEKGGSIPFEVLKELAVKLAMGLFGL